MLRRIGATDVIEMEQSEHYIRKWEIIQEKLKCIHFEKKYGNKNYMSKSLVDKGDMQIIVQNVISWKKRKIIYL